MTGMVAKERCKGPGIWTEFVGEKDGAATGQNGKMAERVWGLI